MKDRFDLIWFESTWFENIINEGQIWFDLNRLDLKTLAERFSASDLCSDGWVVKMWVRILTMTVVLVVLEQDT